MRIEDDAARACGRCRTTRACARRGVMKSVDVDGPGVRSRARSRARACPRGSGAASGRSPVGDSEPAPARLVAEQRREAARRSRTAGGSSQSIDPFLPTPAPPVCVCADHARRSSSGRRHGCNATCWCYAFAAMSDDPRLEPALATVWPGRATAVVPIEAGITNRNYRVEVDGETFVLRLAGTDTELLGIDRAAEVEAGRVAAEAGVSPEVVAVRARTWAAYRHPVRRRQPASRRKTLGNEGVLRSVVSSITAIHGCRPIPSDLPRVPDRRGVPRRSRPRAVCAVPDDYEAGTRSPGGSRRPSPRLPAPLIDLSQRPVERELPPRRRPHVDRRLRVRRDGRPVLRSGQPVRSTTGCDDDAQALLLRAYFGGRSATFTERGLALMRIRLPTCARRCGVVQQAISTLDFDYVDYARHVTSIGYSPARTTRASTGGSRRQGAPAGYDLGAAARDVVAHENAPVPVRPPAVGWPSASPSHRSGAPREDRACPSRSAR